MHGGDGGEIGWGIGGNPCAPRRRSAEGYCGVPEARRAGEGCHKGLHGDSSTQGGCTEGANLFLRGCTETLQKSVTGCTRPPVHSGFIELH